MTRVLLALALGLLGAAGTSSATVSPPPPSTAGLRVQHGTHHRRPVERAKDPDREQIGRAAADLSDNQESPDQDLMVAPGAPEGRPGRCGRPRWRFATQACPSLLLEAPKTGPPSVLLL